MNSMTDVRGMGNASTLADMDWAAFQAESRADRVAAERARLAVLVDEAELSPEDLSAGVLEVLATLAGDSPALRFVRRLLADTARGIRAVDATSYDQFCERDRIMILDHTPGRCSRCRS